LKGVDVRPLHNICDDRGRLCEILRSDSDVFDEFGQVYITTAYPGVVKAWHLHTKQTDRIAVLKGMALIGLAEKTTCSVGGCYGEDIRTVSTENTEKLIIGEHNPQLVVIEPGIWHGFKCLGTSECVVINITNIPYDYYNPDEVRACPHEIGGIHFWEQINR